MRDLLKEYMESVIELAGTAAWCDWLVDQKKPKCSHVPPCFEKSDFCWNYDEAKKRVNAYPNFP